MRLDTATAAIAGIVALVLVAGFVVLAVVGRSTDAYVLFVTGPVVSAVVGGLLSKKVDRVEVLAQNAIAATAQMVPASVLIEATRPAAAAPPAASSPMQPAAAPTLAAQRTG